MVSKAAVMACSHPTTSHPTIFPQRFSELKFSVTQNLKVLIFGTFDHFHPGHRFVLEEAAKRGDVYVVIARDKNVKLIKNLIPTDDERTRQKIVQEAFPQAHVILGDSHDFLAPVRTVKPDVILLGYDQKLPPGVTEKDLGAHVERLAPFEPERYKSSLRRASSES